MNQSLSHGQASHSYGFSVDFAGDSSALLHVARGAASARRGAAEHVLHHRGLTGSENRGVCQGASSDSASSGGWLVAWLVEVDWLVIVVYCLIAYGWFIVIGCSYYCLIGGCLLDCWLFLAGCCHVSDSSWRCCCWFTTTAALTEAVGFYFMAVSVIDHH